MTDSAVAGAALPIAVLAGDGIGPEITPVAVAAARAALAAQGVDTRFAELPYGRAAIDSHGSSLPDQTIDALAGYRLWIVGPHDSAGYPSPHSSAPAPGGVLRKRFGLSANLRPSRQWPGVTSAVDDIDVLIVRENSEGLYADRNMAVGSGEFMPTPDIALAVGVITRAASTAIAHRAFAAARARRGKVTVMHKANVLTLTTGLFRDACLDVACEYPDVQVDQQHVDAMAALLVRRPHDFDVLVTENLFGDILSDLAAELSGSLGLAASVNCSDDAVMAQAVHGAAPDIAGRGVANPVAIVESTAMALRWYGDHWSRPEVAAAGSAISAAIAGTLAAGIRTADLGGSAGTDRFAEHLLALL